MNTGETFHSRLSALIKSKRLTYEDVAEMAGVTAPAVSNWFVNKATPYKKTLETLSVGLSVHPHWLLTGEGPRDAPAASPATPTPAPASDSPALRSARERVEILKLRIEEAELRKKLAELEGMLPPGVTPAGFAARKDTPAPKRNGDGTRKAK